MHLGEARQPLACLLQVGSGFHQFGISLDLLQLHQFDLFLDSFRIRVAGGTATAPWSAWKTGCAASSRLSGLARASTTSIGGFGLGLALRSDEQHHPKPASR